MPDMDPPDDSGPLFLAAVFSGITGLRTFERQQPDFDYIA